IVIVALVRLLTGTWLNTLMFLMLPSYGILVAFYLVAMLIPFIDMPLLDARPQIKSIRVFGYGVVACIALSMMWLTYHFWHAVFQDWKGGATGEFDIKFAGAIVAVVFLAGRIAATVESPVLKSLIQIRRDCAFGRMDTVAAVKQADIAILGMRMADFLQEDI